MTITKSAIAVRGIRGRGPAGRDSFIVETDPSGNFRFGRKALLATKQDVVSGNIAPPLFSTTVPGIVSASGNAALIVKGDNTWVARRYDMAIFQPGIPGNAAYLFDNRMVVAASLPVSLTASQFHIGTNPTATLTFTLTKNGSSLGTVAFDTSGVPTVTFASPVSFAIGDVFALQNQASADATGANIGFTLVWSLT